jgi:hypothetical protein
MRRRSVSRSPWEAHRHQAGGISCQSNRPTRQRQSPTAGTAPRFGAGSRSSRRPRGQRSPRHRRLPAMAAQQRCRRDVPTRRPRLGSHAMVVAAHRRLRTYGPDVLRAGRRHPGHRRYARVQLRGLGSRPDVRRRCHPGSSDRHRRTSLPPSRLWAKASARRCSPLSTTTRVTCSEPSSSGEATAVLGTVLQAVALLRSHTVPKCVPVASLFTVLSIIGPVEPTSSLIFSFRWQRRRSVSPTTRTSRSSGMWPSEPAEIPTRIRRRRRQWPK